MPVVIVVVKNKIKKIPRKFTQHSEEKSSFVVRKSRKCIIKVTYEMGSETE